MPRESFNAKGAASVGPYSHAVGSGEYIFLSGQTPGKFNAPYPARTTIGVASLPLGAQIEIEMIARKRDLNTCSF